MKKLLLLFLVIGIISSCKKQMCDCGGGPTQLNFTIVDESGNSAVDVNWAHNYRLFYLNGGAKTDIDIEYISDSTYKYIFYSGGAQTLPNKGIHEFYINYGKEDTDTLWIETEKIEENWAYNVKLLKFYGEIMKTDSTSGIYLLRKSIK